MLNFFQDQTIVTPEQATVFNPKETVGIINGESNNGYYTFYIFVI